MKYRKIGAVLLALCLLAGCGGDTASSPGSGTNVAATTAPSVPDATAAPAENMAATVVYTATDYEPPPFAEAVFHDCRAQDGVQLDTSAVSQGYVAVAAQVNARLKFQVIYGDITYTYNMENDGTPSVFPLQSGSGHYTFRVMENVSESMYHPRLTAEVDVTLDDEFQPFLRPSDYVPYDQDSHCVERAAVLAEGSNSELEFIGSVFEVICEEVDYDQRKAASVTGDYLPYPDETLETGRGICFDYAALTAAMLRSQGIPTKMIFGYVSPGDIYHAWNMFYTDETGWVVVDFEVSADTWNRLDLTFSANGADETFIGDGGNYTDIYVY